jgi:hypothetical protein
MILLTQGQTKTDVVLTCNEKKTLPNPFYIFKFINQQTSIEKIFYTPNTSINRTRFDQFTIEENGKVQVIENNNSIASFENSNTNTAIYNGI